MKKKFLYTLKVCIKLPCVILLRRKNVNIVYFRSYKGRFPLKGDMDMFVILRDKRGRTRITTPNQCMKQDNTRAMLLDHIHMMQHDVAYSIARMCLCQGEAAFEVQRRDAFRRSVLSRRNWQQLRRYNVPRTRVFYICETRLLC